MNIHKAQTYVIDVLRELEWRNESRDARLRQYLSKAQMLLDDEFSLQVSRLAKAGFSDEEIADLLGAAFKRIPIAVPEEVVAVASGYQNKPRLDYRIVRVIHGRVA